MYVFVMAHKSLLSVLLLCCTTFCSAQTTEHVFDSNGVKINYAIAGEGEAVVLIHGWLSDSTMWGRDASGNTQLNASPGEGFQVIAIDCRGHGKSDKPHEVDAYGLQMAEDVVRLLDHLKINKAHLIGYSMGVYVASTVAAKHPERVLSLVYGGQAPLIEDPNWVDSNEVTVFAQAASEDKGMGAYILAVSPADRPKPTMAQANNYANYMLKGKDVRALAAAGLSFRNLQVKENDIKKCTAPSLFIYGSKETHLKDRVESLSKVLTNCEVKIIDGSDHMTTLTRPEFGQALIAFLLAHKSK